MNDYNEYKVKTERLLEVRESERKDWLLERGVLQEALNLANKKAKVCEEELVRLNVVISSTAARERIKDIALIASVIGNIVNAIR